MHWESQKIYVTHFLLVIFTLLQWFGTKTTLSLRYAWDISEIANKNKNSVGSTWEPIPVLGVELNETKF